MPTHSNDRLQALWSDVEGRRTVGLLEDIVIVTLHPFRDPLLIGSPSVPHAYLPFLTFAHRLRCASAIRLRAAGLSLRRLGLTARSGDESESRSRALCSRAISESIEAMMFSRLMVGI